MSNLKRFFISLLASVAGFWIAISLAMVSFFIFIVLMVAKGIAGSEASVAKNSILFLDLSGEVVDRATQPDFINALYGADGQTLPLNDIVNALENAATDKKIAGVYIYCNGASAGLAQAQAIVKAIDDFKKESGKWVLAYGDAYTQGNYYIACHADSLFLNPIGSVDIHGLASRTPFFKGLLDKLGAEMQVVKVGTYKSAVEPYILESMSEASREQQESYLNGIWGVMKESMAQARGLKPEQFDQFADNFISAATAEDVLKKGLVSALRYRHDVDKTLMALTDVDDVDDLKLVTPSQYCAASEIRANIGKKNIAVLYAVGDIVDAGEEGIVGDLMVNEILDLADDDDIDGLILRVNSPGGSAFASEQIWEALEQYKSISGKPFYVSMGDYAASGGYYISCGADKIFAEPVTLTGSIGIFGMIPNLKGTLKDKLGVNMEVVETNKDANFPSIFAPMTDAQRLAMQGNVDRGYELFVGRVAKGRNIPVDKVKEIAEGRVWDGQAALERRLVDKLGGLDMAIKEMAAEIGTDVDDCCIQEYPDPTRNWWKQLIKMPMMKIKMWALSEELDPATLGLYQSMKYLNNMSVLQCRMPVGSIE